MRCIFIRFASSANVRDPALAADISSIAIGIVVFDILIVPNLYRKLEGGSSAKTSECRCLGTGNLTGDVSLLKACTTGFCAIIQLVLRCTLAFKYRIVKQFLPSKFARLSLRLRICECAPIMQAVTMLRGIPDSSINTERQRANVDKRSGKEERRAARHTVQGRKTDKAVLGGYVYGDRCGELTQTSSILSNPRRVKFLQVTKPPSHHSRWVYWYDRIGKCTLANRSMLREPVRKNVEMLPSRTSKMSPSWKGSAVESETILVLEPPKEVPGLSRALGL